MTHRSFVLSLCFLLLIPVGVSAQDPAAPVDPLSDLDGDEAAPAPVAEEPAPAPVAAPVAAPAPVEEEQPAAPEPAPQPAPAPAATEVEQSPVVGAGAAAAVKADTNPAKIDSETGPTDERCSQLMAQGNTALAQAEGCGGGDAPRWAGTIVSLTSTTAPASRTLPDANNTFHALSVYLAPRIALTKKWALLADITLAYETTTPDDATYRNYLWRTDTRLTAQGNWFTVKDFTFTGGPRVSLPTSQASIAAKVIASVGATMNVIRPVDVLGGLAFIAGGSYARTFANSFTRQVRDGGGSGVTLADGTEVPEEKLNTRCSSLAGDSLACSASNARLAQDSLRAVGAASLNVTDAWSLQLSYLHGWTSVAKFDQEAPTLDIASGPTTPSDVSAAPLPDSRWRQVGFLSLSVSYQPVTWLIASVQGQTGVCYDAPSGGQSATGGCAGGVKNGNSFWLTNPIANKFSNLGLQLTIPIDALYERLRQKSPDEKKTARLKRLQQL